MFHRLAALALLAAATGCERPVVLAKEGAGGASTSASTTTTTSSAGGAGGAGGSGGAAAGGGGAAPTTPNVLLLLDTSGSLGQTVIGAEPYCSVRDLALDPRPGPVPAGGDERSKWIALQEVLTGTFTDYRCLAQSRATDAYKAEYAFDAAPKDGVTDPYDFGYDLPQVRAVFRWPGDDVLCAVGPDAIHDGSWGQVFASRGANGVFWGGDESSASGKAPGVRVYSVALLGMAGFAIDRDADDGSGACPSLFAAGFPQKADGLLDVYRDRVRFGLMTFDALPDPATGARRGAAVDRAAWATGNFSYFRGWYAGGAKLDCAGDPSCGCGGVDAAGAPACALGAPPNSAAAAFEVGARSAAAPPWEGRMMGFGSSPLLDDQRAHNGRLQRTVLATRVYGATPTAALLDDAEVFLTADAMPDYAADPTIAAVTCGAGVPCFGPAVSDVDAGRATSVVLVTDGRPNLDLRPECEGSGTPAGRCPYRRSTDTAKDLAGKGIATYVVGFGVLGDGGGLARCAAASSGGDVLDAKGACAASLAVKYPDVAACCAVAEVARAAGTVARFADDEAGLRDALASVLATVAP